MEYNRQAKRDFAAVGRAWFFYFAVSLAAAFLSSFVAGIVGGEWLESDWGLYMVGLVIPYLFAFPVFFLLIRRKAAPGTFSPEKKKSINKIVRKTIQAGVLIAAIAVGLSQTYTTLRFWYADDVRYEQNVNAKMVFFDFSLKMIVLLKQ